MSEWKETVRFDESEGLTAEVSLDFLQMKSPVRLIFDESGDIDALTPEIAVAADALLQRLTELEKVVADTAFEHYEEIKQAFSRIYGNQVVTTSASDAADLQRLYQLQYIYFPEEPETGRFGLSFSCDWEEEHGFGIQFRNWEIVEVGGDAEAFSFYD